MNIKVVIVWAFVVIIFAGIGIFGMINQDLLLIQDDQEYVPMENGIPKNSVCSATLENGKSEYTFRVLDDKVEKVTISYTATQENIDAYTAASNINQIINAESVNGVSAVLSGSAADFILNISININEYDKAKMETMNDDLIKLSMVVDNISEYNTYQSAISQIGATYTCE